MQHGEEARIAMVYGIVSLKVSEKRAQISAGSTTRRMCNLCSLLRGVVISNFTAAAATARKTSVNLIEKLEMQFKWKIREAELGKNSLNERSKMLFDELRVRMLLPIIVWQAYTTNREGETMEND